MVACAGQDGSAQRPALTKMKKHVLLSLCMCITSMLSYGQLLEVCGDGIDNDGDGFIDCFDIDCTATAECDGSFLGNDANCQATPTQFPQFTMTMDFVSDNETTNHLSRMAIRKSSP